MKDKLIEKQREYIKFLGEIVEQNALFLATHNIQESPEIVEQGKKLRSEISELENSIACDIDIAEAGINDKAFKDSRISMIKKLKADIEMDKMICEMEGYNFTEYLDSLQEIVLSYYNI